MKKLSVILFLCVSVCNYIFASVAHPGPYLRDSLMGIVFMFIGEQMSMVYGIWMLLKIILR